MNILRAPATPRSFSPGNQKTRTVWVEEIKQEVASLREKGLDPQAFERARKSLYGHNVAALNSVDNIANSMAALSFANRELFDYLMNLPRQQQKRFSSA